MTARVAGLNDPLHPAVMRLIAQVAQLWPRGRHSGQPVRRHGERARASCRPCSRPGSRSLSVAPARVARGQGRAGGALSMARAAGEAPQDAVADLQARCWRRSSSGGRPARASGSPRALAKNRSFVSADHQSRLCDADPASASRRDLRGLPLFAGREAAASSRPMRLAHPKRLAARPEARTAAGPATVHAAGPRQRGPQQESSHGPGAATSSSDMAGADRRQEPTKGRRR